MGMSWASEYISTMLKHFLCIYAVCTVFPGGQKRSLGPQEVGLQAAVCERLTVDAENELGS